MSNAQEPDLTPNRDSATQCPLCLSPGAEPYHRDAVRIFLRCPVCAFIHVPARHHLTAAQEKQRYDFHRNDPQDTGYRRFLARLFEPLAPRLPAGAIGLDYGCGPGPVLARMFEETGHTMQLYDLHYAADRDVLHRQYDFVTCTEAAEHFADPAEEWRRLCSLVRPGGWIGVMTSLYDDAPPFAGWYYKNDPTHIGFYARETFEWLAIRYRLAPHFLSASVILLQRY